MAMELSVIDGGMKKTDGAKNIHEKLDKIGRELTKILLKTSLRCDILENTSKIIVQNVESEVPMDDSKLRALLTAVQCGSFGKAAAQLGYTQSAMTHLVSKLEAELGCTLLLRSSKGVRLSEEGEHLLPYIQSVIDACDTLRREAEEQGQVYGRALRIGCFASIARARLPELLRKFRKQHPEIRVDVLVQGNELAAATMDRMAPSSEAVTSSRGVSAGRYCSTYCSGLDRNGSCNKRAREMVSSRHGKSGGVTATSGASVSGVHWKPRAQTSSTMASWMRSSSSAAASSLPCTSTSTLISGCCLRNFRSSSGSLARAMLAKQPMRRARP